MVGTVCYADLWSNYIPLHPDHVKEIEEWLFDNPGVIYHSQEVEFEIVRYCKKHNSDPSKNSVCTLDCGYEEVSYVKLITSKEQQKQLITEIMDLDDKDGLYETVNDVERFSFKHQLQNLINEHSMENGSDTPDFTLASFLDSCLESFNHAVRQREQFYNKAIETLYTEISDEEITKLANEHILYNDSKRQWVIEGMKLYREQLKHKQ
jgi:hypothetical protein